MGNVFRRFDEGELGRGSGELEKVEGPKEPEMEDVEVDAFGDGECVLVGQRGGDG